MLLLFAGCSTSEESQREEEIGEAVKLMGYDSLADMRTEKHPDIMFRDYSDEYEMQKLFQPAIRYSGGINLIRKRAMWKRAVRQLHEFGGRNSLDVLPASWRYLYGRS